jgi:galactokinase
MAMLFAAPEVVAEAPGRVNIIGEHTDYSGGFVLPIAVPQKTRVELVRRLDQNVRASSTSLPGADGAFALGAETRAGDWLDYVRGVTFALDEAGFRVGGFDLRVTSDVPLGAGLASSAALAVALLRALREAFALAFDDVALARLAQRAEHAIPRAPVGLMDPLAACFATTNDALFIDTRAVRWESIAFPDAAHIVVIDSGERHANAGDGYRARRAECERAAELLGVPALRDVDRAHLGEVARLPPPLARRARHVVTENARTLAAVAALRAGDLEGLGALLDASHASLRDDFEVTTPAIDALVASLRATRGVLGARMVGGGFGGSAILLTERGAKLHLHSNYLIISNVFCHPTSKKRNLLGDLPKI